MLVRSFVVAVLWICVFAPFEALGHQDQGCADCLSVEEAQDDLRYLFETLQKEHVDLFARRSIEAYRRHIDSLIAGISAPVEKAQFNLIIQDAMTFGRVAHAKTDAVIGNVMAHINRLGGIIPLSITYRGAAMLTDQWADEGEMLPPGSEIIGLGGLSLAAFEERLRPLVAADTDLLFRAQIELLMPAYVYLVFGDVAALDVTYRDAAGDVFTHSVRARTAAAMYALYEARAVPGPERDPNARLYKDLGDGIAYLQPGPFYALASEKQEGDGDYAVAAFKAFVEDAFARIRESGARDLLLDLRMNPGGDASFSDLIVARLVDKPYRMASRYEVRAGANTKAGWQDMDREADTLLGRIARALNAAETGTRITVELPEVQPIADYAFDGKVWALINRHSYSNTAVTAALLQDQNIATLLGEETADLPTTYGAVEHFTLPHSGVSITYPKAYMVRPSGSEAVRGVVPDIAIAPNPVGAAEDQMLNTALKMIMATRNSEQAR